MSIKQYITTSLIFVINDHPELFYLQQGINTLNLHKNYQDLKRIFLLIDMDLKNLSENDLSKILIEHINYLLNCRDIYKSEIMSHSSVGNNNIQLTVSPYKLANLKQAKINFSNDIKRKINYLEANGYTPNGLKAMITRYNHDYILVAKKLIGDKTIHQGLSTMYKKGLLDDCLENFVYTNPQYHHFFTEKELESSRQKLIELKVISK
ncbi:MAG: hypothetical protein E6Q33_08955 [Neisseriales bacterium]|nr:MAG: hypothetical protein E6Q33_08955 [Neisseriales bacterium]